MYRGELTGRMTPVGGIVVTVTLFAVAMTTVFGADDVCFLECRAGGSRLQGRQSCQRRRKRCGDNEKGRERGQRYKIGKGKMKGVEEEDLTRGKDREREGESEINTTLIQSQWPSRV